MDKVAIVFICDANFVLPTCVAITSLLKNKDENSFYDIYIIKILFYLANFSKV